MYCRKCGKQIDDNAKFCRFCGNEIKSEPGMMKKIEKEAEKKVEKKIRKKKSPVKALILIIVILLLILLVAGGILLVANGTFKNIQETLKNTTETEMDEQQDKVPDEKDEKEEVEEVSEPKETDQQEEVEEVATENEKNTAKAEEKANIIDEGWRQAYADYLYKMMNDQNSILYTDSSNTYNSGVGFTIAYIDEDNIPELIIRYTDKLHVGGAVLCAYSKGNVMTLQKIYGTVGIF